MDTEIPSILFLQIVDVSGSMSGEIITGINSSLTDWKAEIDCYARNCEQKLYWGEIHFAESFCFVEPRPVENYSFQPISIPMDGSGYYETTEYSKLTQAITKYLAEEGSLQTLGSNPKIIIHFFTDGMATDEGFSGEETELSENKLFCQAIKRIVLCGDINFYRAYTRNMTPKIPNEEEQIETLSYEEFVKYKGSFLDEISMTTNKKDTFVNAFI